MTPKIFFFFFPVAEVYKISAGAGRGSRQRGQSWTRLRPLKSLQGLLAASEGFCFVRLSFVYLGFTAFLLGFCLGFGFFFLFLFSPLSFPQLVKQKGFAFTGARRVGKRCSHPDFPAPSPAGRAASSAGCSELPPGTAALARLGPRAQPLLHTPQCARCVGTDSGGDAAPPSPSPAFIPAAYFNK